MINYYKILKVEFGATQIDIKKAFRKLAIIYHPDKNKGDLKSEEIFKIIISAYEVLSNKEKRAKYDLEFKKNLENQQTKSNYKHTNYGFETQYSSNQKQRKSKIDDSFINYKLLIFIILIIIICFKSLNDKTTVENEKADFELENQNEYNRPQSGEIQFKNK